MEEEIILREKEKSLHISRLPKELKEEFVEFANNEFCGDFGMLLKYLWEQSMEYQYMKSALFNGYLVKENNQPEKEEEHSLTMLSGKKIKKGGTNG